MAHNKNASAKKITANLLDESVKKSIQNAAEARNKNDKIKMDDLAADVRNKINAWGAPAGSSYDDTELRNRIAAVEENALPKSKVFNTDENKVGAVLLDDNLKHLVDQIPVLSAKITTLETEKANADAVRNNAAKIQIEDLSDDVKGKIDASFAYYQSVIPSGGMSTITDIGAVSAAVSDLTQNKIGKSEAEQIYRKKSVPISLSDLDSQMTQAANNALALDEKLDLKASKDTLKNYRKTEDKIAIEDLASDVANTVQRTKEMITDVDDAITTAVEAKLDSVRKKLSEDEIGHKYTYLDKNVVINNQNGQAVGDNVGMPYRRQIVKLAGKDVSSHPKYDTYDIYDTMNWLVRGVTGLQYDTALIDEAHQKEICKFAAAKGGDYSAHRAFGGNKAYFGVVENGFTLVEGFAYMLDSMDKLAKRVKTLEDKIAVLEH